MRKIITVAGIIAVAVVAIAWSKSASYQQGPAKEASVTLSPHDIMVKQGKNLPSEHWTDLN